MNYQIKKTTMDAVSNLMDFYLKTITGVVDDFWEEHIYNAQFYLIEVKDNEAGFFSIYEESDAEYLTSLYLLPRYLDLGVEVMKEIIEKKQIHKALVATCDELFLSLCMDFQKNVGLQACFFDGTEEYPKRPAEFSEDCLEKITPEEFDRAKNMTGDFFSDFSREGIEAGDYELYFLKEHQEILGVGIIVWNRLKKGYGACGEIVLEQHRRKGVARSLQMHMGAICRKKGVIPIGGCWYYNENSRKTFESCGRFSKTRLLNISF